VRKTRPVFRSNTHHQSGTGFSSLWRENAEDEEQQERVVQQVSEKEISDPNLATRR
jgi:hypothetical protein